MQEKEREWVMVLWFNLVGYRLPFSLFCQGNWDLCELTELQHIASNYLA